MWDLEGAAQRHAAPGAVKSGAAPSKSGAVPHEAGFAEPASTVLKWSQGFLGSFHLIIVGIDPGSRVAGYAFLRARVARPVLPRDFHILDAGVMRANAALPATERIMLLHEALYLLLAEHKPVTCVIEQAFCDKNVASALRLGEVRGAFFSACGRANVEVQEITPAEVKKTITGNGRADKDLVAMSLKALMGFDRGGLPHDVSDAVAIGLSFGLKLAERFAGERSKPTEPRRIAEERTR